jgi:hypothetical protein
MLDSREQMVKLARLMVSMLDSQKQMIILASANGIYVRTTGSKY